MSPTKLIARDLLCSPRLVTPFESATLHSHVPSNVPWIELRKVDCPLPSVCIFALRAIFFSFHWAARTHAHRFERGWQGPYSAYYDLSFCLHDHLAQFCFPFLPVARTNAKQLRRQRQTPHSNYYDWTFTAFLQARALCHFPAFTRLLPSTLLFKGPLWVCFSHLLLYSTLAGFFSCLAAQSKWFAHKTSFLLSRRAESLTRLVTLQLFSSEKASLHFRELLPTAWYSAISAIDPSSEFTPVFLVSTSKSSWTLHAGSTVVIVSRESSSHAWEMFTTTPLCTTSVHSACPTLVFMLVGRNFLGLRGQDSTTGHPHFVSAPGCLKLS